MRKVWIRILDKKLNVRRYKILRGRFSNYRAVSKAYFPGEGWRNIYEKIDVRRLLKKKSKRKQRKKVEKKLTRREEIIAKIKGQKRGVGKGPLKIEENLFADLGKFQVFNRKIVTKAINPKGNVLTDGKVYGGFREMIRNKYNIYRNVIFSQMRRGNEDMLDLVYANRNKLKDGWVIKVRCFGQLSGVKSVDRFLGEFEITGVLLERSGFVEDMIMGHSGYLSDLEGELNAVVRGKGGDSAMLILNNTPGGHVRVNNVQVSFSYA